METQLLRMRQDAWDICRAALWAADAGNALGHCLRVDKDGLMVGIRRILLPTQRKVWILGAGKASARMAQEMENLLSNRISGGLVLTKYGHSVPTRIVTIKEAGHPIPDENSESGTSEIIAFLQERIRPEDLILFLLSGGASALMEIPAAGLTMEDLALTGQLLLSCGATIQEMNTIRKHLSAVKGGQLARMAEGMEMITLVLSDVPGDDLETIGSGPTVADTSTFSQSIAILRKYGLEEKIPPKVHRRLCQGERGEVKETVKPGDACLLRHSVEIIGSNTISCSAAGKKAMELGYSPHLHSTTINLENKCYAGFLMGKAVEFCRTSPGMKKAFLSGGETTVQLTGKGKGGRNQDLVLNCVQELSLLPRPVVFLSLGTDGTDGPTDAAGAIADNFTLRRHGALARPPLNDFLLENDSYSFFEALGDLLKTGPTGTNVMDLHLLLMAGE
jgi:glycerate 2-kinase